MKKRIKIFLGSSVIEFKKEREEIANFIYRLSDDFEERYDIQVKPLLCEGFDESYSKIRKQEVYNEKIRESDLCFFIFFTKAGEYTREEFDVARKRFEESGKPKIYTYFKVLGEEKAEDSLYAFMEELDKIFGHYYGTFDHIDTIKLRILLNLKLQEMDFLEIKVDGEDCTVDGKKAVSLENISEFANNSVFKELKAELDEVEVKYFALKAKYKEHTCTESEEREYIEIATKRQNLIDAIEELRKNIFNMSLRMCQDEARGEITLRQKEAYKLFEAGDLEGANRILDFDEIKNEYQRRKAIREAEQKKDAQIFIRESKTKIDILTMMDTLSSRFEEIEGIYDEITEVAFEENVEADVVLDFGWFLYNQNKHQKAYDVVKKLEGFVFDDADDEQKANICVLVGTICIDLPSKKEETEVYLIKAISLYESLSKEKPERFNFGLADSYNNAGMFYHNQFQPEKAEEYYLNALAIRETLAKKSFKRFNIALVQSYINLGSFYVAFGQYAKAQKYIDKAIYMCERLNEKNSKKVVFYRALCYSNASKFYLGQMEYDKGIEYSEKAIAILEQLVEINPERFNPQLAMCYDVAMMFDFDNGKSSEYLQKLAKITGKFTRGNSENFNMELGRSYLFAGLTTGSGEAEYFFPKAIEIFEKFAETNPERFNWFLAQSYNGIADSFSYQNEYEKAEEYYRKAIAILESIVNENPNVFNVTLAHSYSSLADVWVNQHEHKKAEEYYLQAIAIVENLIENNQEFLSPLLAEMYDYIIKLYKKQEHFEKAEEYYQKVITIREKLVEMNAEKYELNLANSYSDLGEVYEKQGANEKARECYEKKIVIYEKLAIEKEDNFLMECSLNYLFLKNFYEKQKNFKKTEEYSLKLKELFEKLEGDELELFTLDLVNVYHMLGELYDEQGELEIAEEYYLKSKAKCEKLENAHKGAGYFNTVFAMIYNSIGGLCVKQGQSEQSKEYYEKALEFAKTCPDQPICKKIISKLS